MKNWIKISLGKILIFFHPNAASQLAENGMTLDVDGKQTLIDRLMRCAILAKAEKEKNFDDLAEYHYNFWVKKGNEHFSQTAYTGLEDFFLPRCYYVFEELKRILIEQPEVYDTIVEIGTGQGDVLNHLSSQFSEINKFIGIDLSKDQTDSNKRNYNNNSSLEFVNSDALDWVIKHGKKNTIFFTSGGVLEYFTEIRLEKLLNETYKLGKSIFVAIEPVGINIDFTHDSSSRPYGQERSFSHDYARLYKNAGFKIWHQSKIPYENKLYDFQAFIAIN